MEYKEIVRGIFVSRPNRFIAHVMVGDACFVVHVKNTGRCRELLIPGARVILEHHRDYREMGRKTEYSLVAVYKGDMLINMDSQAPNQVAEEWLRTGEIASAAAAGNAMAAWSASDARGAEAAGNAMAAGNAEETRSATPIRSVTDIRREVRYRNSRFDLAFTAEEGAGIRRGFMEVKGVTLEREGVALFPDAPTKRGVKHLLELADAARAGYLACVLFVIQMKDVTCFMPNWEMDLEFARALCGAADAGVRVLAYDCLVRENGFAIDSPVPVCGLDVALGC